jgi:hypothetical protein
VSGKGVAGNDRFISTKCEVASPSTIIYTLLIPEVVVPSTGMRFGLMQIKAAMSHILSSFEVEPCKDTPLAIVFDPKSFLSAMDGEIPLSFKRIHFQYQIQ